MINDGYETSLALADYRAVVALSEERHFGRAARRLGVTQPALTARVRRMEEALSIRLFERGRAGAAPTEAGLVLLEGARRILDAARESSSAARGVAAGLGLTVRVGMTQMSAYQVVPGVLARFRAARPMSRVRLVEGPTAHLEAALERRELDVAFLHPPLHSPALTERVLCRVPFRRYETAPGQALIAYPRAEAPVLMGALSRREAMDAAPRAEASTILCAIVLSMAGYGAFAAPEDYPHPHRVAARQTPGPAETLETSVAWRQLDRRPEVAALVAAAISPIPPADGAAHPVPAER